MLTISFDTLKFEMFINWKWMMCVNLCISFEADLYKIQINRYINDYIVWLCIERTPYSLIHFVAVVVIVDFTDMHRTPYHLIFLWSPRLLLKHYCYLKRIFHIIIHAYYALCLAAAVATVPYFLYVSDIFSYAIFVLCGSHRKYYVHLKSKRNIIKILNCTLATNPFEAHLSKQLKNDDKT